MFPLLHIYIYKATIILKIKKNFSLYNIFIFPPSHIYIIAVKNNILDEVMFIQHFIYKVNKKKGAYTPKIIIFLE